MPFIRKQDLTLFQFNRFQAFPEIIHFITTRQGGVSQGPYASLNIGYGTDDSQLSVLRNRHRLAKAVGFPLDYFVMGNQVHGTNVSIVTKKDRSSGALHKFNAIPSTDALITNEPGLCLFVMAADCVPLLFFDPVRKVIAATHAGWRGTVNRIASKTVAKMQEVFQCNPTDIWAGIGPSIGSCCYQVGEEVVAQVQNSFGATDKFIDYQKGSPYLDLWTANQTDLLEAGLEKSNIEISGICTKCNHEDFFSSRDGNGDTGRFGAGIMLKDSE